MSIAIKQSYWALALIYLIAMLGSPFAFEWVIRRHQSGCWPLLCYVRLRCQRSHCY